MKKPLTPPEKGNVGRERIRGIFDAAISAFPGAGGPLATLGRVLFPSKQDKAVGPWRDDVTAGLNETAERLDFLTVEQVETRKTLASHGQQLEAFQGSIGKGKIANDHYTVELENYRQLINDGKPATAFKALNAQYGGQRPNADIEPAVLARAKGLMGFCHYHLGKNDLAQICFEDAYQLDSSNPRSVANHALGLLLVQKSQDAYAFAISQFEQNPSNATLAAYLIQAHFRIDAEGNPWESMSPVVLQDESVMTAMMQWQRWKNVEGWAELAHKIARLYPTNEQARIYSAEASFEEVLKACNAHGRFLRADEAKRVHEVADTLANEWEQDRASERKIGDVECSTLHNALSAYVLVGENAKALALARDSTDFIEPRPYLKKFVATLAQNQGDEDLLDLMLSKSFEGDSSLRLERHLQLGNWAAASAIIMQEREALVETGVPSVDTLSSCLALLSDTPQQECAFRALATTENIDSYELLLVSNFSELAGYQEIALMAVQRAAENLDSNALPDLRLKLARQAYCLDAYEAVITLLDGRVDPAVSTPQRRWLASAFASASPREKAGKFFKQVRQSGVDEFGLHATEAQYHFNRGKPDIALPCFQRAHELRPQNVSVILALWQTLGRLRKEKQINAFVESLKPSILEGTPAEKMNLAQVMGRHGRNDALEFAYNLAVSNPEDPDTRARYVGMFLPPCGPKENIVLPAADVVGENVWVRLRDQYSKELSFVVSGQPASGGWHQPFKHPVAAAALGKAVGESFTVTSGLFPIEWRIEELKPKYVALYHDILSKLEHQFPNRAPFYSFQMSDNDISPILEFVKARSEHVDQIFEDYRSKAVPLGFSSKLAGGSAIDFGISLAQTGRAVISATGYQGETRREIALAKQAAKTGSVALDAYTLWFLAKGGWLNTVQRLIGQLLVPRSALDDIEKLIERYETGVGGNLSLSWDGQNCVRTEMSDEDITQSRYELERIRDEIENCCQITGTELGDEFPPDIIEALPLVRGALDGAVVAQRENVFLLTADLHLRAWAHTLFKVPSVGLKGIIALAFNRDEIDAKRAAELTVDMAFYAHSHIDVNPYLLSIVFENDSTPGLDRFKAVSRYIGGPDADYSSHVNVVADFVVLYQHRMLTEIRVQHAISTLLRALVRIQSSSPKGVVTDVYRSSELSPQFGRYAIGWLKGHFLDYEHIDKQEM